VLAKGEPKWRRRKDARPGEITAAAFAVFAEKGFASAKLDEIAARAGLSKGALYLYFETKEDILITVFREKMAEWVASLRREVAAERDPLAKVRKIVALHFRVLEDNPELAEVLQVELRQGQKFFRGASAHEVSAYFGVINDVLEEGAASGQIRRDLPVKIATKMLFGAMDQLATSWVLGKRAYRLTDAAEPVATIFLQGVCAHGV